jgi:hypothetical protein
MNNKNNLKNLLNQYIRKVLYQIENKINKIFKNLLFLILFMKKPDHLKILIIKHKEYNQETINKLVIGIKIFI